MSNLTLAQIAVSLEEIRAKLVKATDAQAEVLIREAQSLAAFGYTKKNPNTSYDEFLSIVKKFRWGLRSADKTIEGIVEDFGH